SIFDHNLNGGSHQSARCPISKAGSSIENDFFSPINHPVIVPANIAEEPILKDQPNQPHVVKQEESDVSEQAITLDDFYNQLPILNNNQLPNASNESECDCSDCENGSFDPLAYDLIRSHESSP